MRRIFGLTSTSSHLQRQQVCFISKSIVTWCNRSVIVAIVGGMFLLGVSGCQSTSRSPFAVDQVEAGNAWRDTGMADDDLECNYREGWRVGYADGREGTNKRHDAMEPAVYEAFLLEKRKEAHKDWHRGYKDGFLSARSQADQREVHREIFQGGAQPEPAQSVDSEWIGPAANPNPNPTAAPGPVETPLAPGSGSDVELSPASSDVAMRGWPSETKFKLPLTESKPQSLQGHSTDSLLASSGGDVVAAERKIMLPRIDVPSNLNRPVSSAVVQMASRSRAQRSVPELEQADAPLALSGSVLIQSADSVGYTKTAFPALNLMPPNDVLTAASESFRVQADSLADDSAVRAVRTTEAPKGVIPDLDLDISDLKSVEDIDHQAGSESFAKDLAQSFSGSQSNASPDMVSSANQSLSPGTKVNYLASPDHKSMVSLATSLPEAMMPFISETERARRQLPSRLPLKLRRK